MPPFAVRDENTPDLESLGVYVRDNRLALGLTQTALAERLGWVQERISLVERGKYGLPSLSGLARLAHGLESPLYGLIRALGYEDGLYDGLLSHGSPDTQRLALIAHDFGNHLTTAQGRLALLSKQAEKQGNMACLRDATKATQAVWEINQCVNHLLGLAARRHNVDSAPSDQWILVKGRHEGTAGHQSLRSVNDQEIDDGVPRRHSN